MKKYAIPSLLFLTPFVAAAADHCTNPDEYTIDRRCYVTDEQKTQKPYNAVVGLLDDKTGENNCTGTIVNGKDGELYIYTARHCIRHKNWSGDYSYTELDDLKIKIKLQDNRIFEVRKFKVGINEDVALYKFLANDKDAVKDFAVTETNNINSINAVYDAKLVGYGSLKIMSDKEIDDFKQAYEEKLRVKADEDGGIEVSGVKDFSFLGDIWADLTKDYDKLKTSVCDYYVRYGGDGCQGWHGDSGAPLFDKDGRIMAIHSKGKDIIGGEQHARVAGGAPGTDRAGSVSLLKEKEDSENSVNSK